MFGAGGFPFNVNSHFCFLTARKLVQARSRRKDENQLRGSKVVVPSSEKVINSARPPTSASGTGPPSPSSNPDGARLSAE